MSIADKLQELIDSKADMKSAIAEKGVEVEGGLTSYASAIRKIQQGSGEGSDIDWSGVRFAYCSKYPLPPDQLYKCGNLDYMFKDYAPNSLLPTFPKEYINFDTSWATSMRECYANNFFSLAGVRAFSNLDVSNITDIAGMFDRCDGIGWYKSINEGLLDDWNFTNVEYVSGCFNYGEQDEQDEEELENGYAWDGLTTIPNWDYSVFKRLDLFHGHIGLESIPQISIPNYNYIDGGLRCDWLLDSYYTGSRDGVQMRFQNKFPRLTNIGGFVGLKTSLRHNFIGCCPNLTVESLENIIRDLYDWTANIENLNPDHWNDAVSGSPMVLSFGEVNLNKLTDDQIAVAIAKGWTLI